MAQQSRRAHHNTYRRSTAPSAMTLVLWRCQKDSTCIDSAFCAAPGCMAEPIILLACTIMLILRMQYRDMRAWIPLYGGTSHAKSRPGNKQKYVPPLA